MLIRSIDLTLCSPLYKMSTVFTINTFWGVVNLKRFQISSTRFNPVFEQRDETVLTLKETKWKYSHFNSYGLLWPSF